MIWQTPPDDIWHRIYTARRREAMKLLRLDADITADSYAHLEPSTSALFIDDDTLCLLFPDRTPTDKLRAIADAINAALAAARDIDGAGRD